MRRIKHIFTALPPRQTSPRRSNVQGIRFMEKLLFQKFKHIKVCFYFSAIDIFCIFAEK